MHFQIDVDTKAFENQLKEHKSSMKKIARRMMGAVLSKVKKDIRNTKLKGQVLKKRSGTLLKTIRFKTKSDFTATLSNESYYARFHEYGPTTILPKKGKYLTFAINGEIKRVTQVTLPKRTFILPVLEDYFNTNKASTIFDEILQDALNKIYQKGVQ